jgi:cell division protein FtsB
LLFALLVLASALFIEGIGTYISVLGLSALFAWNPIVILMAVSLDVGKVVAVSYLYKEWVDIGWFRRAYMTIATVVLIIITSAGVFGFLSGEFQKAIADTKQQGVQISALTEEKDRLQKRKEQIDAQIANLPSNYSNSRVRLMNSFKEETSRINNRLAKIDEELPKLQVQTIEKNVKVGPIVYVAEAFQTTPEQAVKWVILTIIFVFDPLAVALLVAGNSLLMKRKGQAELLPPPVRELVELPAEAVAAMVDDPPSVGRTLAAEQARQATPEPAPKPEVKATVTAATPVQFDVPRSSLERVNDKGERVVADNEHQRLVKDLKKLYTRE